MCSSVITPLPPKQPEAASSKVGRMTHHEAGASSSCRDSAAAPSSSSFAPFFPLFLVVLVSASTLRFSSWLPFVIPLGVAPAAIETYVPAGYDYDDEHTRFDNTAWTWGTDYVLAGAMSWIAVACATGSSDRASRGLRICSSALLACYAASTLAGGWAHQHCAGVGALNTPKFRLLWTVTVGNVAFASCHMGLIGREVQVAFGGGGAVPQGPW
jgi:hypothetical protein